MIPRGFDVDHLYVDTEKNPTPTHATLLQNLQCVTSLSAVFDRMAADNVFDRKEIEVIMDRVPPGRKERLSDWPIPQVQYFACCTAHGLTMLTSCIRILAG